MQEFHQAQLIAAPTPPEFYRIHAFLDEMQTQAAGAHILQVPAAELVGVNSNAVVLKHNFKSGPARPILGLLYAAERYFDRLMRLSLIGVTNDIRQRFVYGQNHGAAFRLRESEHLRELFQRISDDTKCVRIAWQFHSEKQNSSIHTCHVTNTPSCNLLRCGLPFDLSPSIRSGGIIPQIAVHLRTQLFDGRNPDKDTDGFELIRLALPQ